VKSTSHIWKPHGPAKSIVMPSSSRYPHRHGDRVTLRRWICERCGGVISRVRVPLGYTPSATAKIDVDGGQRLDCEEYTVYNIHVS
jgi:hypothetical protein